MTEHADRAVRRRPIPRRLTGLALLWLLALLSGVVTILIVTRGEPPRIAAVNPSPSGASPPAGAVGSVTSSPARPASPSASATASTTQPSPSAAVSPPAEPAAAVRDECRGTSPAVRADALLANRYTIGRHPAVTLPANPRWNENPLKSRNWEYTYHTLRFVLDLLSAGQGSGGEKYLERARFLLRDWIQDNPPGAGRSIFSWNDHATAWRAEVLVCAAEVLPRQAWLDDALVVHGAKLATPAFYRGEGNHALNQNVALLDIGCRLKRPDWTDLARRRLAALVVNSVDAQGVTNEQAVFYEMYNWRHYDRARRRLEDCGLPPPPELDRIDKMPDFLANATLPNGQYVMLGDSGRTAATPIRGTTAEFAATGGNTGKHPASVFATYKAGFVFGRSGWGDERPFADESAYSVRFGPGLKWHGHADGGSVTLFALRARLLEDPGIFTLNFDAWRRFAVGRSAHNVVTVDGRTFDASRPTALVRSSTRPSGDEVVVHSFGYAGVDATRRIVYSRGLGYLVVEDRLRARSWINTRQLWHLAEDAKPAVVGTSVGSKLATPHVRIIQLVVTRKPEIVIGRRDPVQGWISYYTDHRTPAPTIEVRSGGTAVRYITLLAPAKKDADVSVSDVRVTVSGFSFLVTVNGQSERVTATASTATVAPVR